MTWGAINTTPESRHVIWLARAHLAGQIELVQQDPVAPRNGLQQGPRTPAEYARGAPFRWQVRAQEVHHVRLRIMSVARQ